jgi:hypothetical protein
MAEMMPHEDPVDEAGNRLAAPSFQMANGLCVAATEGID